MKISTGMRILLGSFRRSLSGGPAQRIPISFQFDSTRNASQVLLFFLLDL